MGEQPEQAIRMTRRELVRGWVFFPVHVLILPFVMAVVQGILDYRLGIYFSEAAFRVLYYLLSDLILFALFWSFLQRELDFFLGHWRKALPACLVGGLLVLILSLPAAWLPFPAEDPALGEWSVQLALSPWETVAVVVILMPIAEEILFRGLLFETMRRYGKALAWWAGTLCYALYCVWTYVFSSGELDYLILGVRYLPVGIGMTWAYVRGGSIWSPIALHAALNGLILLTLVP